MTIEQWANAGATAILAGYIAIDKYITSRARKKLEEQEEEHGLASNPARCAEHRKAIDQLQDDVSDIKVGLAEVRGDIKVICSRMNSAPKP